MSGFSVGGSDVKKRFEQALKTPFFTFSKPYLEYIGKGKIFNLLYVVMAVISLLLPLAIIFMAVNSGFFRYGAKYAAAFVFAWLVIAFACWIGFQLWWDRRTKVAAAADSEFIATPIFSRILQTFGEWLGTLIGIIGAGAGLVATIFLGRESYYLFRSMGLGFMNFGAAVIIIGPIIGFFIITRFIAEQLRLFAALANNTKEIAENIKGND
ncbi:MAG: hypothetical protein LBK62_01385 [Treponema sp.]|jgi:MFS family permease|nr:hypothetical protein [Treponema sp.]